MLEDLIKDKPDTAMTVTIHCRDYEGGEDEKKPKVEDIGRVGEEEGGGGISKGGGREGPGGDSNGGRGGGGGGGGLDALIKVEPDTAMTVATHSHDCEGGEDEKKPKVEDIGRDGEEVVSKIQEGFLSDIVHLPYN